MSVLDDIHAAVMEAFLDDKESAFRPAQVVRTTASGGGAYTEGTSIETVQDVRAFVAEYSDFMRGHLGIPDTDVQIMVLQRTDTGDWVTLVVGDSIRARGQDWTVVSLSQDPVRATFVAQARPNG